MKNNTYIHLLICVLLIFSIANHSFAQNIKEVKIGTQIWMAENLNVDRFRNGDTIPRVSTLREIEKATENKTPAWCYYKNDSKIGAKYGRLYNWWAINDPRGLAPEGWHVPSEKEWEILLDYTGGKKWYSQHLKEESAWKDDPDKKGKSDQSKIGFGALPGGLWSSYNIGFSQLNESGAWWSIDERNKDHAIAMFIFHVTDKVNLSKACKCNYYSVRLIKIR